MQKIPPKKVQDGNKEKAVKKSKVFQKPNLDSFIRPGKEHLYVTYAQAANYYSLPYYTLVNLAKQAKANIRIRKGALVDMEKLSDYVEKELRH